MKVITEQGNKPIKAWIDTKEDGSPNIEDSALSQLRNLSRLPFIHSNGVAVMPDVHAGIGSTVGTVIATDKAVIPAAVGVDIGCGMNAVRLSLKAHQLPDNLSIIRSAIESAVPLGKGGQTDVYASNNLKELPFNVLTELFKGDRVQAYKKYNSQVGTLGSGNHFIELCIDEEDYVWVMLHSGSRGIGNMIGSSFITKAKKNMEKFFISLPDADLAYFPEDTEDFKEYIEAVNWAQDYALENRKVMLRNVLKALHENITVEFVESMEAVNCHHNYVQKENHFGRNLWVTRKGAVSAKKGEFGIIPGSMGQKSYIVKGKGKLESYCSCSHGAGRVMSRTQAKKSFSLVDLVEQTKGVECRKDIDVLDEIPSAYKNLDVVMENQKDLIEVVHTLKAVLCIKGN